MRGPVRASSPSGGTRWPSTSRSAAATVPPSARRPSRCPGVDLQRRPSRDEPHGVPGLLGQPVGQRHQRRAASTCSSLFGGLGDSSDNWSTSMTRSTPTARQPRQFSGSVLGGTWVDDASPAPSSACQADLAAEAAERGRALRRVRRQRRHLCRQPEWHPAGRVPERGVLRLARLDTSSSPTVPTPICPTCWTRASCGANSVQNQLDGFAIVGGHEYAEAVTDPEPSSGLGRQPQRRARSATSAPGSICRRCSL